MAYLKTKINKVTGVIVPSAWTDMGEISNISVLTIDEKEYLIDLNEKGKELFNQINEQVEIDGELLQQLDGPSMIYVLDYRKIKPAKDLFWGGK